MGTWVHRNGIWKISTYMYIYIYVLCLPWLNILSYHIYICNNTNNNNNNNNNNNHSKILTIIITIIVIIIVIVIIMLLYYGRLAPWHMDPIRQVEGFQGCNCPQWTSASPGTSERGWNGEYKRFVIGDNTVEGRNPAPVDRW